MKLLQTLACCITALLGLTQCYVGPPPDMVYMDHHGMSGMTELGTVSPPPHRESYAPDVRTYPDVHTSAAPAPTAGFEPAGIRHYQQGLEAGRREREDGDPYNPAIHITRYRLTAGEAASFESGYAAGYRGR